MKRLHFIVEGQTEETFVKEILRDFLIRFNIIVDARSVYTKIEKKHGRIKIHRGGLMNFEKAYNDISAWIKEDDNPDSYFTTMFDLFHLPDYFPGFQESKSLQPYDRISRLETELAKKIDHPRGQFIPYIQLHEFEALLFSEPEIFEYAYPGLTNSEIKRLIAIANKCGNPELIDNDSPPSYRIKDVIRRYDKVLAGSIMCLQMNLDTIRKQCRHFSEWIGKLEKLSRSDNK